jgi:hypothetical protein
MNTYKIRNIIWDFCKRPIYRGKATTRYIHECLDQGLPLNWVEYSVEADNGQAAAKILEEQFGAKMSRWTISCVNRVSA